MSIRIRAARIRSLAIMRRFTFKWSTKTPAIGLMTAIGSTNAMVTVVTSTGVPCQRNVMRLMTPKRARKSPKTLTNCASQSVRNGLYFRMVFAVKAVGAVAGEVICAQLIKPEELYAVAGAKKFIALLQKMNMDNCCRGLDSKLIRKPAAFLSNP
jgi:hypothetical protein